MPYHWKIEAIIADVKSRGRAAEPYRPSMEIAMQSPSLLAEFVQAVVLELPDGGTYFDAAIGHLPLGDIPNLVRLALDAFNSNDQNDAAESFISAVSLQHGEALHPHLKRIFDLGLNSRSYTFPWPWRNSGEDEVPWLLDAVQYSSSGDARRNAWQAMLETRLPTSFDLAMATAGSVPYREHPHLYLYGVGFEKQRDRYHKLHPDATYHIRFPTRYDDDEARPFHLRHSLHPTWNLNPAADTDATFGGTLAELVGGNASCAVCGSGLHHLITLAPIPVDIGVTGMASVSIATCLSCLGPEQQKLYYVHDSDGHPVQIAYDDPTKAPRYPAGPLKRTQVQLVPTPERWRWQDWATSNGRQNLNRVGGFPCFIQDSEYTHCPRCEQTMPFLLQLGSGLASGDGSEWSWMGGGICYVFWCNTCKVSGVTTQWT